MLIPARLRPTRLPDKPLLPIAGLPMIVHVWRRAVEADLGPVVVACAEAEIADAVRAAGGEAVLTDPALPVRAPTASTRRWAGSTRSGGYELVVNLQGDLPDAGAGRAAPGGRADRGCSAPTWRPSPRRPRTRRSAPTPTWSRRWSSFTADDPTLGRALYFTRATAPPAPGPVCTTSASTPSRRDALERFAAPAAQPAGAARAAGAAAGARERHEHRRPPRRHGAVRRRHPGRPRAGARHPGAASLTTTDTGPAEPERTIAFQGLPGAYSHMACRQALPGDRCRCPATPSRTRSRPCARAAPSSP